MSRLCSECGRKLTEKQTHYRCDIEGNVWMLCELCNGAAQWEYDERMMEFQDAVVSK